MGNLTPHACRNSELACCDEDRTSRAREPGSQTRRRREIRKRSRFAGCAWLLKVLELMEQTGRETRRGRGWCGSRRVEALGCEQASGKRRTGLGVVLTTPGLGPRDCLRVKRPVLSGGVCPSALHGDWVRRLLITASPSLQGQGRGAALGSGHTHVPALQTATA